MEFFRLSDHQSQCLSGVSFPTFAWANAIAHMSANLPKKFMIDMMSQINRPHQSRLVHDKKESGWRASGRRMIPRISRDLQKLLIRVTMKEIVRISGDSLMLSPLLYHIEILILVRDVWKFELEHRVRGYDCNFLRSTSSRVFPSLVFHVVHPLVDIPVKTLAESEGELP